MADENKIWRWLLFAPLLVLPANAGVSQDITPEDVKASYILKICPFSSVDIPPRLPTRICYYEKPGVPENESVGQIMAKMVRQDSSLKGRSFSVTRFQSMRNFNGCDIFYIPASEEGNVTNILTALGNSSTLTISAAPHFIIHGGMIGFVVDNEGRVKMEANLDNIKKQNVRVDAQILEIMQQVIGRNQ